MFISIVDSIGSMEVPMQKIIEHLGEGKLRLALMWRKKHVIPIPVKTVQKRN